jgi:hypothetical protein
MIQAIIDKLKKFNIKNIVSIDNDWKVKESVINENQKLDDFFKRSSITLNTDEKRLIRNNSLELVKELIDSPDVELNDLKEKVYKRANRKGTLDSTLASLDQLFNEIQNNEENIKVYKKTSIDIDLNEYQGNTLYFLDKNMGQGYEDVIVEKILQIKSKVGKFGDLILIYSNECGDDYDSHTNKLEYLNSKCDAEISDEDKLTIIYQLWAIKKVGDVEKLITDINETLSKSMYGNSLGNIINLKKESEIKAYEDLLMIDIEDLQGTFADSFIEGDNIIASFDRIMKAFINKNYNSNSIWSQETKNSYQFLLDYEKMKISLIKGEITRTNEVNDYKGFKESHVKNKLKNSRTNSSEYAIADYSINKLYYDIGTGDLFRYYKSGSDKWTFCMVISQECNNIIRMPIDKISDNPNRKNREIRMLILEADEIPEGDISNNKFSTLNSSISTRIWPIRVDNKYYSLSPTEDIISVDPHILDMCSLNENGHAIKEPEITKALKYKGYQSELFFNNFYNKPFWVEFEKKGRIFSAKYKTIMEDYLKECSTAIECNAKCMENNDESFIKEMEAQSFNDIISMFYGIHYTDNGFKLERICRVESKRALLTIQDYVHKLSRTGADPVIAHTC